jgi:uncharacterized protein (DUF305 family)
MRIKLSAMLGLVLLAGTARAQSIAKSDQDFVAAMIALDQHAIDLARIELQYGREPALREHAQAVLEAHTADLAAMIRWQEAHPSAPAQ